MPEVPENRRTNDGVIQEKMNHMLRMMEDAKEERIFLKKILMGNGIVGVAEMARRAFEYMQLLKSTRNGRLDWAFRIVISLILTYIAVKVGLK